MSESGCIKPSCWSGSRCQDQRNLSLEAFMNLKLSIAALFLAIAVPATAQTVTPTPAGCEGAASGTVLADGTLCTGAGTGTGTTTGTGTGTLGTNITPLMGGDDDSDGDNEGAEHQNSATHTENNGTDHDSAGGNDDNGSDHDSSNGNDDNGSDHDNDSDNGDDD